MRIRQIKPEFWENVGLGQLPRDIRLMFIGLWSMADHMGIISDHPTKIKAKLFPYDHDISHKDIHVWVEQLAAHPGEKFIHRENGVITIVNFHKHQRLMGNEYKTYQKELEKQKETKSINEYVPSTYRVRTDATFSTTELRSNGVTEEELSFSQNLVPSVLAEKNLIWGDGLELLMRCGNQESSARAYLGRMIKQYGEGALNQAISATLLADPAEPKSYLTGCLNNIAKQTKAPQPQEGNPRLKALLACKAIRNRHEPEWTIKTSDLETRPNAPGTIYYQGKILPIIEFEGVSE